MADEERELRYTPEDLKVIASSDNIAEYLEEEELDEIGKDVVSDYEDDFGRMSEKIDQWNEILKMTMQVQEEKNFPWPGAANINVPLITAACIRFGARIYPEIVQSGNIARVKTEGQDVEGAKEERAKRVESHLNWQLSEGICNWESDMDVLLSKLPMYGCYYKKVYFSQLKNEPVVEICNPKEIVTSSNNSVLEEEERISQIIRLNSNKVIERIRTGQFLDIPLPSYDAEDDDDEQNREEEFIEQHCYLDLDGDEYKEPYVVTVHKESRKVYRIIARFTEDDVKTRKVDGEEKIYRIEGFNHFIEYMLLPAFDESNKGLGFGELLVPFNQQVNSNINQITDAGTLANTGGGFIGRGARMDSGPFRLSMGEWLPVETRGGTLKENIVPRPAQEASPTLMTLLQLMVDMSEALVANTSVDPAELPANQPAATTLAVIEEGLKIYSSIHKRIYASLKKEIRKIYKLNKLYGDPEEYAEYHDIPEVDMFQDYEFKDLAITPATSPQVSTDMQRMIRANGLIQLMGAPGVMESGLNPRAVVENYLVATHQPNIEKLFFPPAPQQEGPSLEEQMLQMQADLEQQKIDIDQQKADADSLVKETQSIKNLSDAEKNEAGAQLETYQQGVSNLKDMIQLEQQQEQIEMQRQQQAQVNQQGQINAKTGS